jgi:GNAT superfamily N-acetyltransferase
MPNVDRTAPAAFVARNLLRVTMQARPLISNANDWLNILAVAGAALGAVVYLGSIDVARHGKSPQNHNWRSSTCDEVFDLIPTDTLDPTVLDAHWISRALLLSAEAGWNQTAEDWKVFFEHGKVLGIAHGDRLVATAAVLPYGGEFGWLSMVLVTAEWRRRGLATRVVTACVSLLRAEGKAALLDAAPDATEIYEKLGFVPLCRMERWEGNGSAIAADSDSIDLERDQEAFGVDRKFLLEGFLVRAGSLAFRSAHGFALLRRGAVASHIGPIVADPAEASNLVTAAIRAASGRVYVDVLDAGRGLIPTLISLGFRPQRQFTRMALGISQLPGNPARLLAAAGPEFG